MSSDAATVYAYPTEEQLNRWDARREQLGIDSRSRFVCDMVEAGIKADQGFSTDVAPDETAYELRQQRNDLKDQLAQARERIEELEDRLHSGEREAIERFIERNPGSTYDDIVRHIIDTVPERVNRHLDDMEGDALRLDADAEKYYPIDGDQPEGE